jgi:hypothetical protein
VAPVNDGAGHRRYRRCRATWAPLPCSAPEACGGTGDSAPLPGTGHARAGRGGANVGGTDAPAPLAGTDHVGSGRDGADVGGTGTAAPLSGTTAPLLAAARRSGTGTGAAVSQSGASSAAPGSAAHLEAATAAVAVMPWRHFRRPLRRPSSVERVVQQRAPQATVCCNR